MDKFNKLYESIMESGNESVKSLRADLKKAKLSPKQVTVKLKRGSTSEQILVIVKDEAIDLDTVRKIADKYADDSEGSGTFVQVQRA